MMDPSHSLLLTEEILLLALKDEKGTVHATTNWKLALGGAVLAELILGEHVTIVSEGRGGKKKMVELARRKRPGNEVLDEAFRKVRDAGRRAQARTWVQRFSGMKHLRDRVAGGLCRRRILRADEDKVLFIFTRKIYPERDPAPEQALVARMRDAILSDDAEVEARTAIIVSLAHAAGLLKASLDRKELRARKARIKAITSGDIAGGATRAEIEAMRAAIVAVSVSVTAATTSS